MCITNICSQAFIYSLVLLLSVHVCIIVPLLFMHLCSVIILLYSVILLSLLTVPASEHSWLVLTTLACMSRFRARLRRRRWNRHGPPGSGLLQQFGGVHALSKESSRSGRLLGLFCEVSAPSSILRSDVRIVYSAFRYFVTLL